MILSFKKLAVLCSVPFLFACASSQPQKVPEFTSGSLPALQLAKIKPRTMSLKVENVRASNIAAKNTAQVEKAVFDAVQDSLIRGGFKIAKSPNQLTITLMDCDNAPEGSACVKTKSSLEAREFRLGYEAQSSNGYSRGNSNYQSFGDVTEAYFNGLQMTINGFEKKYLER